MLQMKDKEMINVKNELVGLENCFLSKTFHFF